MHPPRPFLIQMSGAPGSGKSTLARTLARSLNGTVISHDLVKSFLLDNDIPFEQSAKLTYDFQWALAKDLIEQGQATIIVDSVCNYEQTLAQGEALAQLCNYEYRYIECRVASLDILETRLQGRVSMRSQRKSVTSAPTDATDPRHSEDYRTVFKRWMEYPFRPAKNAILVDSSTSSPEECLASALAQLVPLTSNGTNSDLKSQIYSGSVKELSINIKTSSPPSSIESQHQSPVATLPASPLREQEQLDISDITAKFPSHWAVPVIDVKSFLPASGIPASVPWTILVRRNHLAERKISIDEISRQILSKDVWSHGDTVIADLVVRTSFGGTLLVLSPRGAIESDLLVESGSSANVTLVLGTHGTPEVQKSCSVEGIDGNGRPWLQRQLQFFDSSSAVKDTAIFVKPLRHTITTDAVSIAFPYVPSHTLGEMALAGMGSDALLRVADNLLGDMAVDVWPRGCVISPSDYVDQAHFRRMRRRVTIARAAIPELNTVLGYESIMLNGRRLLGFEQILEALSQHPSMQVINPKKLGEIHGDLNLHNILCQSASNGDRPVVLIDPRGVPLHFGFDATVGFEPGDYAYDISKLKFSLSGFSEIRKGYYSLEGKDNSFNLVIKENPGSATLHSADQGLFEKLASNKHFLKWVDAMEHDGLKSLELRVLLGEAANYVADAACALGRDTIEEVLPLFLYGLAKLNDVLALVEGSTKQLPVELKAGSQSPNVGVAMIQSALLGSTDASWPWDVLEVLVKSESTIATHQLLSGMVGEYLPQGRVQGQTHAVLSSARRTQTFLCDNGVSQSTTDRLRIVTVTSTGPSTRSQYVARQNDKLLSPGPWGLSPLKLIVLEANQLAFPPTGGRWVVENDSFFVLSHTLQSGGDSLAVLTSKRLVTKSNSPWRVCIDSTNKNDAGLNFATSFREINTHEVENKLLQPTSAIFLPNHLAQLLAKMAGEDYAARTSDLLIDFVLPRFMARESWVELCHARGFGINSDIAWGNGQQVAGLFPEVELADGGEEMVFHHFGSDVEYTNFIDGAGDDPLLASLASLPTTARWVRQVNTSTS